MERFVKYKETVSHLGLLLLAVVVAYWPVSFLQYSLKWDNVDGYLPLRYYVSESIRNGHLPLWQPYANFGYPIHADPQSAAWYLPTWIVALLHGYTMGALQIEFTLTIFAAGMGMYFLAKDLGIIGRIALVLAISYACCGFFVGNAQHLTWLISGACIPWVFHFYYTFNTTHKYGYAMCCAFIVWLLLTGGYPAFFICIVYCLFIGFILFCTTAVIQKKWMVLIDLIKLNAVFILLFLVLSSAFLLSVWQAMPYINRGDGVSLELAESNPFSIKAAISFILPFATTVNPAFYAADISMINGYMGLLLLIFVVLAVVSSKSKLQWLLLCIAVVFFCIAMGGATPLRAWLYEYILGMNLFRFSALFRVFFIIPLLLAAGLALQVYFSNATKYVGVLRKIVIALGLVIMAVIVYATIKNKQPLHLNHLFSNYEKFFEQATLFTAIIINGIVQLTFLGIIWVLLLKPSKFNYWVLLVLVTTDMCLATTLNRYTVVSDFPAQQVDAKFVDFPKGFPVPRNHVVLDNSDANRSYLWPLYRNTNIYYKTVGINGYNSFALTAFDSLEGSKIAPTVLNNELVYFSERVRPYTALHTDSISSESVLYVADSTYTRLAKLSLQHNFSDSVVYKELLPNNLSIETSTIHQQFLTIMQNSYRDKHLYIDGIEAATFVSNYSFTSCVLPAGKHQISLKYTPKAIIYATIASASTLVLLIVLMLFYRKSLF